MNITYGDTSRKAELGDIVELQDQEQEVVRCEETDVLMLNIDADELRQGDLAFIKKLGLTISNPETDRPVALGVDHEDGTFGAAVATFLAAAALDEDEDDDSSFFGGSSGLGSGGFGGFGGGFGGFGGGSFSGGGASGGF